MGNSTAFAIGLYIGYHFEPWGNTAIYTITKSIDWLVRKFKRKPEPPTDPEIFAYWVYSRYTSGKVYRAMIWKLSQAVLYADSEFDHWLCVDVSVWKKEPSKKELYQISHPCRVYHKQKPTR